MSSIAKLNQVWRSLAAVRAGRNTKYHKEALARSIGKKFIGPEINFGDPPPHKKQLTLVGESEKTRLRMKRK